MTTPPAQAPSGPAGVHLVLFDGVCGLCDRLVQFLLVHDANHVFNFASLQSDTGRSLVERWGGDPGELTTIYVVANYRTRDARVLAKSSAALFVAGELGWPLKAIRVLRVVPTPLLDRMYDVVARLRYRVFGRYEQCVRPRPEFSDRFVD